LRYSIEVKYFFNAKKTEISMRTTTQLTLWIAFALMPLTQTASAQTNTLTTSEPTATPTATPTPAAPASCPAILNHTFPRLQDQSPQSLCQYAGKVVVVVNTASYCGFTKQYEGLEALNAKYSSKGLVVLGFPSNQFGNQEPGNDKQIADFCFNTYGVKFPMFSKTSVKGKDVNPFYKELIKATDTTPKWNFYKYLIDRNGKVLDAYTSVTAPDNKDFVAAIEKALAQ
jgi:glutathione peroxidase